VFRNFSDGVASEVYELPHFWGGTGHVILNGTLYYNRYELEMAEQLFVQVNSRNTKWHPIHFL